MEYANSRDTPRIRTMKATQNQKSSVLLERNFLALMEAETYCDFLIFLAIAILMYSEATFLSSSY